MRRESINSFEFKNISITFGKRRVMSHCSFEFPLDGACRFVFENDIEKFFFFHAISQIKGFQRGKFLINGRNILEETFEEFINLRLNMGFGFSTRGLIHNQTLEQNVILPILYHQMMGKKEAIEWVDYLFDFFQIREFKNLRPAEVSPQTQKCTLIIRAFVHRPEMVILDSPETLLTSHLYANLLQLIDEHQRLYGMRHLFFSTQDEHLSDCLSSRAVIVRRGKIDFVKLNPDEGIAV